MSELGEGVAVLARGGLADETAGLGLRLALAIPLGGLPVSLYLCGPASLLGLADPPEAGAGGGQLGRQLESLIRDERAPVAVERESLEELGMLDRELREGVSLMGRDELLAACARARHCLVI